MLVNRRAVRIEWADCDPAGIAAARLAGQSETADDS
jgi:hypothetical protein